jgi:hypothetical protein
MNEDDAYRRIEGLFAEIHGEEIKARARKNGGIKSWTRQRDMPLHGILTCTLGKKGLSAALFSSGRESGTDSQQIWLP